MALTRLQEPLPARCILSQILAVPHPLMQLPQAVARPAECFFSVSLRVHFGTASIMPKISKKGGRVSFQVLLQYVIIQVEGCRADLEWLPILYLWGLFGRCI